MSLVALDGISGPDPIEAACRAIRNPPQDPSAAPAAAGETPAAVATVATTEPQSPSRSAAPPGSITIDLSGGKTRAVYDADLERIAAAWSDAANPPTHVTFLDLSINKIGDRGATALADAIRARPAQLLVLELDGNDITDRSMDAIGKMLAPKLAVVTSAADGSKPLVAPSCLTRLDLSCNRLSDKGLHDLVLALYDGQNSTLRTLLLRSNLFGDNGCQRLFAWTEDPICQLTTLHVSGNTCTEGVLPWLVQALQLNATLTDLNISNTVPRISDMQPIRDALHQKNHTLLALSMAFDGKVMKDSEVEGALRRNRAEAAKRKDAVEQLKQQHRQEVEALNREILSLKDQLADAHRTLASRHREP